MDGTAFTGATLGSDCLSFLVVLVTVSKSDCYVIITLPTATAKTCRTKTLANTNSPTWNESFSFRVPKALKVSLH